MPATQPLTPPAKLLQPCWPGRSDRRRQAARLWISRDGGGVGQRISHRALRGCAVVAWWAAHCGQLGNGGKRNLNWFAPACQLSKAAHAADAPPCAHASMSAIPSHFLTTVLLCVRRTFEQGSIFFSAAPRELHLSPGCRSVGLCRALSGLCRGSVGTLSGLCRLTTIGLCRPLSVNPDRYYA